jgi:radical SAM protein with 4Fe4S-binding SPASM domain
MLALDSQNVVDLATFRRNRRQDASPACVNCSQLPPCDGACCGHCLHGRGGTAR